MSFGEQSAQQTSESGRHSQTVDLQVAFAVAHVELHSRNIATAPLSRKFSAGEN